MKKFIYKRLVIRWRNYGYTWEFDGKEIKATDEIDALNIIGEEGWQLVDKEQFNEYRAYIMMREFSVDN